MKEFKRVYYLDYRLHLTATKAFPSLAMLVGFIKKKNMQPSQVLAVRKVQSEDLTKYILMDMEEKEWSE